MNQSQSQNRQSQSQSSAAENAAWAKDDHAPEAREPGRAAQDTRADEQTIDAAAAGSPDTENTPAGYGDRGAGGQPVVPDMAPAREEQPGRHDTAPGSKHARQAEQADDPNRGAFLDE